MGHIAENFWRERAEHLQRQCAKLFDQLHSTPCEQIRHAQEVKELQDKIQRMNEHAHNRDRRIRAQRRQLHETWQIVEARGKWMGSPTTHKYIHALLDRNMQLKRENESLKAELVKCGVPYDDERLP